jgi:trk system potassium uptake protein TrkH
MRPVLANLGFVLQLGGIFTILPIILAFLYNEIDALISLLLTGFTFFALGFVMNAFSIREDLDFKSSCVLLTTTFFLLGLVGSVPYFYINMFGDTDMVSRLTNNYFESVSGYTTTGLTLIEELDAVPRSIMFYRSMTHLIGGLGIIFILLTFFYRGAVVRALSRLTNLARVTNEFKKSFIRVLEVYSIYILIFILIFFLLGVGDIVNAAGFVFGTLMTGGFSPTSQVDISAFPYNIFFIVLMIFGATSFFVHYRFIRGHFKRAMTEEFLVFLLIILLVSVFVSVFYNIDPLTSLFNVASASTTSGFHTIDIAEMQESLKIVFITLMAVGGMGFSTAGGLKIFRLIMYLKAIPWSIRKFITRHYSKMRFDSREFVCGDVVFGLIYLLLTVILLLGSAFIFNLHGFGFVDSLFETSSAFATVGLSAGITSLALAPALKWLLIFLMVFGRIEIIPFFVAITSIHKKRQGKK